MTLAVLSAVAVAAAGGSAASPPLGPATWHPPWDAGAAPDPVLLSVALAVADVVGLVGIALGLAAVRRGTTISGRVVAVAALGAVGLLVLVPPLGSADHLSYAAYGRIAAAGGDPFVQDPLAWRSGTDPVAGAIQPPWQHTPSVYGPVATLAHAMAAVVGSGDLRLTVWVWQLLAGMAFLATGYALDRAVRHDPAARARVAVLWTLNPLLLRQLVLGAHVDVLAAAAAAGAVTLAARRPVLAGALVGVAAGVKLPYALFGAAVCWALLLATRRGEMRPGAAWRHLALGLLGAAAVLVPVHLWSGPHTYEQLERATRMISFATPWRLVADALDPTVGHAEVRETAGRVAVVAALLLAALLARRVPAAVPEGLVGATAQAATVLAVGWVLTAPYALPWYDAIAWVPLILLRPSFLDAALLVRLAAFGLAYVPGRVVGLTPELERVTLEIRRELTPWVSVAVLLAVVVWALTPRRSRSLPVSDPV